MESTEPTVFETDFSKLNLLKRGKVRDMYDLGDTLLMVATDRISAFDVIMPDPVPQKGKILTQISLFWFDAMKPVVSNHIISSNVDDYPEICKPYAEMLRGRSILVKKAKPLPIECVVRGYISGSGWKSYQESGSICGIKLPDGLKESEKLPEPIFTPSTKEEVGIHDVNIDFEEAVKIIGKSLAEKVKELSISIYEKGAGLADKKGIIILYDLDDEILETLDFDLIAGPADFYYDNKNKVLWIPVMMSGTLIKKGLSLIN